jgi:hypothetical protein
VPFFLEGVALEDELMQADGIHPNAAAQPKLLANVWPVLQTLIEAQCDNTDRRSGFSREKLGENRG